MSRIIETSLIVKKETKFDKIRKGLFMLLFGKEYQMFQEIDNLLTPKRIDRKRIIIPNEIGKKIEKF